MKTLFNRLKTKITINEETYFFSGDKPFLIFDLKTSLLTTRNNFGDFLSVLPLANDGNPSGTSTG